jgi:hypothetical protein
LGGEIESSSFFLAAISASRPSPCPPTILYFCFFFKLVSPILLRKKTGFWRQGLMFVLDALGERWATDLSADHYNLPVIQLPGRRTVRLCVALVPQDGGNNISLPKARALNEW